MTTHYKATDTKGRVHSRSTASRTYSHAVMCGSQSSWAGSLDLAQKATAQFSYLVARGATVEIAPAVEITAKEYRAIKAGRGDDGARSEAVWQARMAGDLSA